MPTKFVSNTDCEADCRLLQAVGQDIVRAMHLAEYCVSSRGGVSSRRNALVKDASQIVTQRETNAVERIL